MTLDVSQTAARHARITPVSWRSWLLPISGMIALIGYFGSWVGHPVAGLVVSGLDLAEYVKFLPATRSGEIPIWREGFYLPLLAVSLAFSFSAFRTELGYGGIGRGLLLAIATVAALNMLPPAWTPALLRTSEFRQQTVFMGLCIAAALTSPFLALLPRAPVKWGITLLAVAAILQPTQAFLRILPEIAELYHAPLRPGWGMLLTTIGLIGLALAGWPQFRGARR
jgi:hypothetical protein